MSYASKFLGTTLLACFISTASAYADEVLQLGMWNVNYNATLAMNAGDQPPRIQEKEGVTDVCISDSNSALPDAFADNFALKPFFRYECDFADTKKIQNGRETMDSTYEISYTCKPPVGSVSGTVKIEFSEYDWNDNDGVPSQIAFIHVNQSMEMGQNSGTMKLAMTVKSPEGKSCN